MMTVTESRPKTCILALLITTRSVCKSNAICSGTKLVCKRLILLGKKTTDARVLYKDLNKLRHS